MIRIGRPVHFVPNLLRGTACGIPKAIYETSTDLHRVSCLRCQRTRAYREKRKR